MPVGRGIMIMNRLNIRETTTEILTFQDEDGSFNPPGPVPCGDTVTCGVTVTVTPKIGLSNIRATGTVSIIDTITNTVLGTDDLVNGGPDNVSNATIEFTQPIGNYSLQAIYSGIPISFESSSSENTLISISKNASNIVFEGDGYEIACPTTGFTGGAYFTSGGDPILEGFVGFRLYKSDNIRDGYVAYGPYDLEDTGDGYMGFELTSDDLEFDVLYGVQAIFLGSDCISTSATPSGVVNSLLKISTAGADATNISGLAAIGSTTFCRRQTKQFTCQVSADEFLDPSDGSVSFYCAPNPAGTPLTLIASDTSLIDGYALATVPADRFPTAGNYYVYAKFSGRGTCYADSALSSSLSVVSTQNNVTATNDMDGFRAGDTVIVNMHLSSAVAGTISGRVTLAPISGITGPTLGPVLCSGPHTGFDVPISIPGNTYSAGSGIFRFNFIGDGTGCYSDRASSTGTIILT